MTTSYNKNSLGCTVAVTQTAVPDYRVGFFRKLRERQARLCLLTGSGYFSEALFTDPRAWEFARRLENRFLFGRRLLWQAGGIREALGADVWIFEMNPRILSSWFVLGIRRVLGRPSIGWGHAWPRGGRSSPSVRVRNAMRSLCHGLLVYSFLQKQELVESGIAKPIHVAANAIYERDQMTPVGREDATGIIYVGRMVPDKKVDLLLDGFVEAMPRLPPESCLHLVGDGPLVASLAESVRRHGIGHRVVFHGHVSNPERLREIYARSLVSASPGYAGLSLTQSFGYGVPVLIGRDEPHSPEIEVAREGFNAVFFASDDSEALAGAIVDVFLESDRWRSAAKAISGDCSSVYSIEAMVDAFVSASNRCLSMD